MTTTGLEKAIKHAGNAARLAEQLGVRRQALYQWDRVPAERVLEIERITGVPRQELRPDLYPPESNTSGEAA